jgi:transposase
MPLTMHTLIGEMVRMAPWGTIVLVAQFGGNARKKRTKQHRFAWAARFRRLARDYERLATTRKGLHLLAFAALMLRNLADTLK